jgi:O-antigen/teichoic acid export membrane protein
MTTAAAMLAVIGIAVVTGLRSEMAWIILATGVSKSSEAVSDAFYGLFMRLERLDWIAKSLMIKAPLSLLGLAVGFYATGSVFWGVMGIVAARVLIMITYDFRNAGLSLAGSSQTVEVIPEEGPRPRWDRATLNRLFWLSLPLGFVTLLIALNANIPRYFIEFEIGTYALGIFAAVTAFQKVGPTVVQALGRSAAPRLANYYAVGNVRRFRRLTLVLIGIGTMLGAAGVIVALVAGRWILTLLYGPEYAFPGLLALVMVAGGVDYLATMLLFVITAARRFRVQLPMHVWTTGAVALACVFLVPTIGLTGAALALVAGQVVRLASCTVVGWSVLSSLGRRAPISHAVPGAASTS